MKASDKFKTVIESYLTEKADNDTLFAADFKKETKNLESCFNYIFGEVKKTGECAFDNQEIFDIAVLYYTDDSIAAPVPVHCKAVVSQPLKADLFAAAPAVSEVAVQKTESLKAEAVKAVKSAPKTLTLFDL
ncbi:PcfK-like family protein [Flavobacterium plurextorum]|uniref:PcfK-like family protein n=1 Tax=Flavobacterium TaxID=237 RepID=UPI00214D8734|nr:MULTISPECIES: PcfK-like family protein [Flavobacterium]UUW08658.1 PcfK-like family protein [Flavobacterium plurextorum]